MKILVFDDNPTHRAAALAQLKDHDLTVVGNYDEARDLLTPEVDYDKAHQLMRDRFGDVEPDSNVRKAIYEEATTFPDFDVVLTDLLVPASDEAQGSAGLDFAGREMPVGIFIGLLAPAKGRAKYVDVSTDSDHHSHPASACFDNFNAGEGNPTPFTVNGSKVLLSNTRKWIGRFDPQDLSKALDYKECDKRSDTVRAKNWARLLEYLLRS